MQFLSAAFSFFSLPAFTITAIWRKSWSPVLVLALISLLLWPVSLPAAAQSTSQAGAQTNVQSQASTSGTVQFEPQVNINTADAETLALALDGVGMARAQDIISYREQHGDFKTVDDLQKVRGIGKATLERNRNRILVDNTQD